MIEIHPNLYIGNQNDYEFDVKGAANWWVVHACKEPYHRHALKYESHGAPKNHPEYLSARRENRLILNLVDANDPNYIPASVIDDALQFIDEGLSSGHRVLVHCNQGESRSPTIGLLYLARFEGFGKGVSFAEAESQFAELYPSYRPGIGMRSYARTNWQKYAADCES